MAGLEVVGVVLGAIPLLIEAGKQAERLEFYWMFRDKFPPLLRSIHDQMMAYRQNIKFLLGPLNLDLDLTASLVDFPERSGMWRNPKFRQVLYGRFGNDEYELNWLIQRTERINEIIQDLAGILRLLDSKGSKAKVQTPGYQSSAMTALNQQQIRLAISFTSKRKLVVEFEEINRKIRDFLSNDMKIAQMKGTVLGNTFKSHGQDEVYKKKAQPFRKLQNHVDSLYRIFQPNRWECDCGLQHPCGIAVNWVYDVHGISKGSIQLYLEGSNSPERLDVDFYSFEPESDRSNLPKQPLIDQLSSKLERTGLTRGSKARTAPKTMPVISALAGSALDLVRTGPDQHGNPEKVDRTSEHKAESGPDIGYGNSEGLVVSQLEPIEAGLTTIFRASEPSTKRLRRSKRRQKVRFDEGSAFSQTAVNLVASQVSCDFLHDPLSSDSVRYLQDTREKGYIAVRKMDHSTSQSSPNHNPMWLREFWKYAPKLDQRIRLATKLAYTIIGFGTSAWFPQGWDDGDITVCLKPRPIPFYYHLSMRQALRRDIKNAQHHAEMAVFTLGVIILQVIYQKRLEEQPFYRKYWVDGKPSDFTLELAAREWQQSVEKEYGPSIADVIFRCVHLKFSITPDLEKEEFIQEMLLTVIEPLEDFVLQFENSSS
ncbi:hypothetical protein GCG54_00000548 [Colletotrichum gloeosporioides]|uniref:Uncharacterized protein n=1 Tax=Colletotrichum gloeosporioides TaxID=474922 RepID=A0A8H4FJ53_COLGL|nr:uncharacterized protein GCG54_00000548 [Colletotrichum gloeosporioides]KAF3804198.1 hypothetical protein GCG54_00000548 [Colletotrichum gloeosporioides]